MNYYRKSYLKMNWNEKKYIEASSVDHLTSKLPIHNFKFVKIIQI